MAPFQTVRRAAALARTTLVVFSFCLASSAGQAFAGYVCELYESVPNQPGGDSPAEVYWTDTIDPGAAERACMVLYSSGDWLSWYLREAPTESFPPAWRRSDLLVKAFPD